MPAGPARRLHAIIKGVADRHETFSTLLAVWNGEADLDALDSLVTPTYRGHLGPRDRDLAQLKRDIAAYRGRVPGVRFRVEHQFGQSTISPRD